MSVVCIFFFVKPSFAMQRSQTIETSGPAARVITFVMSAIVAKMSFSIAKGSLWAAFFPMRDEYCLVHGLGALIHVPATAIGSLATYPALLALGVKNSTAAQTSGAIFGCSMLANSLSHWVSLKSGTSASKGLCVGMSVVTGVLGLATLSACLGE